MLSTLNRVQENSHLRNEQKEKNFLHLSVVKKSQVIGMPDLIPVPKSSFKNDTSSILVGNSMYIFSFVIALLNVISISTSPMTLTSLTCCVT